MILAHFLCDPKNKLALVEGHADKDEYGRLIQNYDFDPLQLGLGGAKAGKRNRKQISKFGTTDDEYPKKGQKKQGSKPKNPPTKKNNVSAMFVY